MTKVDLSFFQLARAADEVCMGERVDCQQRFYRVQRIDGKCNNLRNENWGATAIGMRGLADPDYGQPGKPGDLHSPRKVGEVFWGASPAQLCVKFSRKLLKLDVDCPGECGPTGGVQCNAQDTRGERLEARQEGVHPHGDAVRPVP